MKIGNLDFENTLIGNTQVEKIYLGADIVWENQPTPPTPIPAIYLEAEDLWPEASGGSVSLSVSSNTSWTLTSSNSAWAYPTVSAGTGNANLSIIFSENEDTEVRTITITASASGVTEIVEFAQQAPVSGAQAVVRLKRNIDDLAHPQNIGVLPDYSKLYDSGLEKVEAYCIDTDKGPIDITDYIHENMNYQDYVNFGDLSDLPEHFDEQDVGDYYFYYTFSGDTVPDSFFQEQSQVSNAALEDFTEIYVSGTTREIESYAFYSFGRTDSEDNSLLRTIIFEDGVETIGQEAFNHIYKVDAVVIPQSVSYIGTDCFSNLAGSPGEGIENHISYYFQGDTPPQFSMENDSDLGLDLGNILICVPEGYKEDYQQAIPFYEYCIEECGGCFEGYEEFGYEFDETLCDCLGGDWQDDECQFGNN